MTEPRELDQVRAELQRLGYLSHRVERFLLQDALLPKKPWRGVPKLAGKVGLLAGSLLALANAVGLAAANGALPAAAADLLPLFVHLAIPTIAGVALGFVALVAAYVVALSAFPRRSEDVVRVAAAMVATATLVGAGVFVGWDFLVALPRWQRAAALAALPVLAAAVAKWVADGLLAFGIRVTRRAPRSRLVSRRAVGAVVGGCVALAAFGSLGLPGRDGSSSPSSLPTAPGERVALVGVDGVLPEELDFLLARGDLPGISARLAAGGLVAILEREAGESPAELWTTIATGQPVGRHGVAALDSFRLAGTATPLARSGPWRLWFERVLEPLGLAEYRPLLASRRRAHAVWELASRGGAPIAAINWWATFPAEPLPGLVVAHGAFGMLRTDERGAVEPAARRAELATRAAAAADLPARAVLEAALPQAARGALLDRAFRPDTFYRELARTESAAGARAVAVYLPALDLAADGWSGPGPAWSELVRAELAATDQLVAELAQAAGTVVVLFDPGRRGGSEGRALILRAGCTPSAGSRIEAGAPAAALLRALGLPQSAELPEPPALCPWPEPPARIPTYGPRHLSPQTGDPADYLESLRALGYL